MRRIAATEEESMPSAARGKKTRAGRAPSEPVMTLSADGRVCEVDGVRFQLAKPDATEREWIGQEEILRQLLACWLVVDERDQPLTPRIKGIPGIGKTTLGMAAARRLGQDLYIYQCTADTRPEDLLIT